MKGSVNDRMPRGAIAVVAAGILLTVFVAWISDEELVSSKPMTWSESHSEVIAPVGPESLGPAGSVRLTSTGIDVTERNSEREMLFQVGAELRVSPARIPIETTARCVKTTEPPIVNARTPNRPAAFPGPMEDLALADWPGDMPINHRDRGSPFSTVTLPTAYMGYGSSEGVAVEWGDWRTGRQEWSWSVPAEQATEVVALRFVSLWRTVEVPRIEIACRVERGGARARLATGGGLAE